MSQHIGLSAEALDAPNINPPDEHIPTNALTKAGNLRKNLADAYAKCVAIHM